MAAEADQLLQRVHRRLGGGIDIQTFADGTVEVRCRRACGEELSDERFTTARRLKQALEAVLQREEEEDAVAAAEASP